MIHRPYSNARGHDSTRASAGTVGAHSFYELDAWQLSNDLKLGVYGLPRDPDVQRDGEFRAQIQNAAASAPRNIAEGFGRYLPREFSQYLRIANGSLMETIEPKNPNLEPKNQRTQEPEPEHLSTCEPMNPVVLIPPSAK